MEIFNHRSLAVGVAAHAGGWICETILVVFHIQSIH